jgi:hypothetical protein
METRVSQLWDAVQQMERTSRTPDPFVFTDRSPNGASSFVVPVEQLTQLRKA